MRSRTIAWLLGCVGLWTLPILPPLPWLALLGGCTVLAAIPAARPAHLPLFALIGFLWTGYCADTYLDQREQISRLPRDVLVEGAVTGIPQQSRGRVRFYLEVERVRYPDGWVHGGGQWQLTWYGEDVRVLSGERRRLFVRRSVHRFTRISGGFDRAKYRIRSQILATGYIRDDARNELLASPRAASLDGVRQHLSQQIASDLSGRPVASLVAALAVGDRQALTSDDRAVLMETGTAHLVAISGLHIGLVAGFVMLLGTTLWRAIPLLAGRYPAHLAGALGGLGGAACYAALAGFGLPTQRALIMLSVVVGALVWRRPIRGGHVLSGALLVALVLDPFAPLDAGFWLSFGAVACILWMFASRVRQPLPMVAWLRLQWGLLLFMAPAGLLFFGQVGPAALPANLVAVPWISIAVVPPVLVGTFMAVIGVPGGSVFFALGAHALELLWPFLEWLAALDVAWLIPAPGGLQSVAAFVGVLLLLAPAAVPLRVLGAALVAAMLVFGRLPSGPPISVALLGDGPLAPVVVTTPDVRILVDTGRRRGRGADPGRFLLRPYLRHRGIGHLDWVVLGGVERARTGGLKSILERPGGARVVGPATLTGHVRGLVPCEQGSAFVEGRVVLDFPGAAETRCPVRLRLWDQTILIPGQAAGDPEWWNVAEIPDLLILDGETAAGTLPGAATTLIGSGTVLTRGQGLRLQASSSADSSPCGVLEWRTDARGETVLDCHGERDRRLWDP